jgi:amino acid adenylation domain-containing protein
MTASGTFLDLFAEQVQARPDAPALVSLGGAAISYRDLDQAAGRWAALLGEHGHRAGEVVPVSFPRITGAISAALGVWKAGGVLLLLDPERQPWRRLAAQVADAKSRLLISSDQQLPTSDVVVLTPEMAAGVEPAPGEGPGPDDPAYVVYTSSSTGAPKGVRCGHAGLLNVARACRDRLGVRPDDRIALNAPFVADACILEIALSLSSGASLNLAGAEDEWRQGPRLRRFLTDRQISVLRCTPARLRGLDPADYPDLRLVISGGEALDVELARHWAAGRRLFNAYGPAEATIVATLAEISGTEQEIPLGSPLPGCQIEVLRPDLTPADVDEIGELCISGTNLACGYTNDEFNGAFVTTGQGRTYRSGDLAVRREDGSVVFIGRDDDQVKISGFRVELGEITHHLRQHPGVGDAVARLDGNRLVGYLTPANPAAPPPRASEIHNFLGERLPHHFVPMFFTWLPELPTTPWGKVDVDALPGAADPDAPGQSPRDPVQEFLLALITTMLDEEVGPDDDLFLEGFSSIHAARLMIAVEREYGIELEHYEVISKPTVAELAGCINEHISGAP